jgi:hypothetical protein
MGSMRITTGERVGLSLVPPLPPKFSQRQLAVHLEVAVTSTHWTRDCEQFLSGIDLILAGVEPSDTRSAPRHLPHSVCS